MLLRALLPSTLPPEPLGATYATTKDKTVTSPTVLDDDESQQQAQAERASRQVSGRKRPPTKTSWKPGQSGNPAGRPRTGQSLAEVFASLTDMTADELAAEVGGNATQLGRWLQDYPADVPMKRLVGIRVLTALMMQPSAGLLNALINADNPAIPQQEAPGALEADASESSTNERPGRPSSE